MKAILEFNLEDLDEKHCHLRCIKSLDLALALWEIVNEFCPKDKYGEKAAEFIRAQLERYAIDLDDLMV